MYRWKAEVCLVLETFIYTVRQNGFEVRGIEKDMQGKHATDQ
jgi:hypothetical protein